MQEIKKLSEADIIRMIREEWEAKLKNLAEEVGIDYAVKIPSKGKVPKEEIPVLSPGLKVRHKKSQIRYTVISVNNEDCVLRTPEGKDFLVTAKKLEKNYEVD
jgi:hypothetical protein